MAIPFLGIGLGVLGSLLGLSLITRSLPAGRETFTRLSGLGMGVAELFASPLSALGLGLERTGRGLSAIGEPLDNLLGVVANFIGFITGVLAPWAPSPTIINDGDGGVADDTILQQISDTWLPDFAGINITGTYEDIKSIYETVGKNTGIILEAK